MKKRLIFGILGRFMIIEAVLMLLPAAVSLVYGEYNTAKSFLISALISVVLGTVMHIQKPQKGGFYAKEGLMTIGLLWIMWSLIGALPFYISREIPKYIDCFFETASGFTTTGATILTDIEALSKGMLFWRAFTHWVGGMGVLVFVMAIIPVAGNNSLYLMRAEVPGPAVSKLVPKGMRNAKLLYGIYFGMCVIEFIMLVLGGMPVYDSIIHTFSTAGTGGFSCKNASIAAYNSAYLQWVITAFMFLFSINFNLYYFMLIKKFSAVAKDSEWKIFTLVVIAATVAITASVYKSYPTFEEAVRTAAFQVVSVISTTGFITANYDTWSGFAKIIIIMLMFVGACAGSTGGGLKIARIEIMAKTASKTLRSLVRPNSVSNIKIDGKIIDDETVRTTSGYFIVYMALFAVSVLLISINNLTVEESISSVATCINNVGPGLGIVGPVGNFSTLSFFSKLVLSLDMLLGRLEIFPLILLLVPSVWRRKFI